MSYRQAKSCGYSSDERPLAVARGLEKVRVVLVLTLTSCPLYLDLD